MMPTLEDVWKILRLRVTSVAVTLRIVDKYFISCMLGRLPPDGNHSIIQLTWLRTTFKQLSHNPNRITLLRHTLAYLLYLVGHTIFVDSTYGIIPKNYLQFFEDIDIVDQYAWGAAALAVLF
ncbi:hypothetical protein AMTR_s00103p00134680 [Amborella trichopoda]|uniref:Aminotransferase-like plant mobile domain-containing protein n=1 Tax=Amborella trichopoda TaxID=13333 RepID=W1NZ08_AMBTC|nr:hypothetical protein AMTR_s00103p00134680 [Amborella trichopoda]